MQHPMNNGGAIATPGVPDELTEHDQNVFGKDSREVLAKRVDKEAPDMVQQAWNDNKEFHELLEDESPAYAVELRPGESPSAVGSVAEHLGVTLRDQPHRDVYSTPLKDIGTNPAKLAVLKACSKLNIVNKTRKPFHPPTFQEHQLAFGIGDFAQGSAFNPYSAMPLQDGTRLKVFPPISAIVASVNMVPIGGTFLIPEYKEPNANAADDTPAEWMPGTPIPLGRINAVQSTLVPKWWAGGFTLDAEFRNSAYGAELVMMRSDKEAIQLARAIVTQGLDAALANSPTQSDIDVSNATLTTSQIIDIAMTYNNEQEDYMITTLIGDQATVKKYLQIDRSTLSNNSTSMTPQGSLVGNDTYGGAPANRMVYDINLSRTTGLATNQLLGIDASETIDLSIQSGSEEETETYVERTRAYEFAYTIKYLAHLRVPDSGEPRRLFT